MKSLHNIILAIGILTTAGGVAGVGLLYRDMKTENLIHARTGMIPIKLSEISDWKNTTFTLYQPGTHKLCLSLNSAGDAKSNSAYTYLGEFEISILTPNGVSILQKLISRRTMSPQKDDSAGWRTLDTFQVNDPTKHSWTLRARIIASDSTFSNIETELFILPPQQYDIENYLTGNMYKLLVMGFMVLTGFMLMVYSGSLKKRT